MIGLKNSFLEKLFQGPKCTCIFCKSSARIHSNLRKLMCIEVNYKI